MKQLNHLIVGYGEVGKGLHEVLESSGVYGLYGYYEAGERKYDMCKWCLRVKDQGQRMRKCYYEICRKCYPTWDGSYTRKKTVKAKNSEMDGIRITMSPGHFCPKHKRTKMVVFKYKAHPMQPIKDEIYKAHGHDNH